MIAVGSAGVVFETDTTQFSAGVGTAKNHLLSFERTANRVGTNMMRFGRTTSIAMLPVTAALGGAVRAFGTFDQKMIESTSIMGDLSDSTQKEMRDTALALSQASIFGADKLAESYFFLASAGLNAEQSMAALRPVTDFATAGAFDLASATDLLTDAQSALGLSVNDTERNMMNMVRVSDVLVKANTLANAKVEQFSESLTNKAGAALKTLNKDVEEGVAVLAAFADQGVKGQVAGEQLGMVLTFLEDAALNNQKAFEKYGFSVFDQNGRFRNMADIVENLETALAGKTDETRSAILAELGFASRTQKTLKILLGTSDAIREYESQLREAAGTTQTVADKQAKSFNAQMRRLGNTVGVAGILIGEQLAPGISKLADKAQATVKWFNELNPGLKRAVALSMGFLVVLGPLTFALGGIVKALGWAVGGLAAFKLASLKALAVAAAPWIAVGAAVAAVAGLIFVARGEGDMFFDRMSSGFDQSKKDAHGFFDMVGNFGVRAFRYLQFTALSTIFNLQAGFAKMYLRGEVFFDSIQNGFKWIGENGAIVFWGLLETITKFAYNASSIIVKVFENLWDNLVSLFTAIWNKVKNPGKDFEVDMKGLLDDYDERFLEFPELRPGGIFQSDKKDGLDERLAMIDRDLEQNLVHAYSGIYKMADGVALRVRETAKDAEDAADATNEKVNNARDTMIEMGSPKMAGALAAGSAEAVRSISSMMNSLNRVSRERDAQSTREAQLAVQEQAAEQLERIRASLTQEGDERVLNINY